MSNDSEHKTKYVSNALDLVRPSWAAVKLNAAAFVGLALTVAAFGLVTVGLVFLVGAVTHSVPATGIAVLVAFVLCVYVGVKYLAVAPYRLTLAMARHQHVTLRQILVPEMALGWRLVWTNILVGLVVLVGFILLVIPGLIAIVYLSMTSYVVVEEGLVGWDALQRSRQLVRHRFWDTAAAIGLPEAFSIARLVPVLGDIISIAAALVLAPLPAMRYVQLVALKRDGDGTGVETNQLNYLIVALALIAAGLGASRSHDEMNRNMPVPVEKTRQAY